MVSLPCQPMPPHAPKAYHHAGDTRARLARNIYAPTQIPAQGSPLPSGVSPAPAPTSGCVTLAGPSGPVLLRPSSTPESHNTRNLSDKENEARSERGLPGAQALPPTGPMTLGEPLSFQEACAQSPGPS